jgi:uncharacterized membrane protein YfcA
MNPSDGLLIASTLCFAAFVHTTAGFGSALFAMPVLSLLLGLSTAAPLQAMCSTVIGLYVLYHNWRGLHIRDALWLLPATACGIPVGVLLLSRCDASVVLRLLGFLLIAYAGYAIFLAPRLRQQPESTRTTALGRAGGLLAGFLSGVLGGAYNVDGPPLVVYGSVQRWPKARFRSLLQTVFLFDGWLILGGHIAAGHVNATVGWGFLAALPGVVSGILLGRWADQHLPADRFEHILLGLLLLLGLALLR